MKFPEMSGLFIYIKIRSSDAFVTIAVPEISGKTRVDFNERRSCPQAKVKNIKP